MNRLTTRNSMGVAVLKIPYQCERCGEETYRFADYGNGEPIKKLAEYEDLEGQRRLLKLPCAVGDTVYHLCTFENGESEIIEMKVGCVDPFGAIRQHRGDYEVWNVYAETDYTKGYFKFSDFGETVFLTHEEAEAALKEISKE